MLLLNPQAASAYLDPGAGNALVYIAVTLVSVAAYAAKELFYRLTGRKNGGKAEEKYDAIAIFSEGKSYWTTFKPIVDALMLTPCAVSFAAKPSIDSQIAAEASLSATIPWTLRTRP